MLWGIVHLQQVRNDRQNQEFRKATCLVWRKALLEFGICWLTEEPQCVRIFTGSCFCTTIYGESKINLRLTSEWCSQKRKPQNDGVYIKRCSTYPESKCQNLNDEE